METYLKKKRKKKHSAPTGNIHIIFRHFKLIKVKNKGRQATKLCQFYHAITL